MVDDALTIVHLAASPFVGGPERQMLGLAQALPPEYRSVFLSFAERGLAQPFLEQVRQAKFPAITLKENFPHVFRAAREVAGWLRRLKADVICCNGYKPDVVGFLAGRQAGIPVVCVAHGWTAATWKVRCYEQIDRWVMRWSDCTVCVSAAMAARVRAAGVPASRLVVIRNAIRTEVFDRPDPAYQDELRAYFSDPPERIVVAAGRLSPEKGFSQLIEAAALVHQHNPRIGFVLFGAGPLLQALQEQVLAHGLQQAFVFAGFRTDVEKFLPWCDLVVNSSFTEGLPVVVLEGLAAGVPVVATAVGGTPEVLRDGEHGFLVPSGNPVALARRMEDALADEERRRQMGCAGRKRVAAEFSFRAQSIGYEQLFRRLCKNGRRRSPQLSGSGVYNGEPRGMQRQ